MAHEKIVARVLAHGGPRSSIVGIAASLALVIGYFLPWTSLSDTISGSLGISSDRVVGIASRSEDQRTSRLAARLRTGDAISGSEWAAVLDAVEDGTDLEPRQQHAAQVARIGVLILPYAAGGLAILLLSLAVAPARLMRVGLHPLAAVLAVARTRFASSILLVLTMAISLVVFAVTNLLWVGAKLLDESESSVGTGIVLMAAGAGVGFLSGFLGYGRGRLRALIWSLVLIVLLAVVIALRVFAT